MKYPGSDLGARITAADAAMGTACGTLLVPQSLSGLTVSVAPTVSSCHRLLLRSPITWAKGIGPKLASNTQVIGDGAAAVQTVDVSSGWITGKSLSNVAVENIWAQNTYHAPGEGTVLLLCFSCNGVRLRNNHTLSIGAVYTGGPYGGAPFNAVNPSNISQNVTVDGNYMDGQNNPLTLAEIAYTQHVSITNNAVLNAQFGVEWWGGNAGSDGLTLSNTRWVQDLTVTRMVAYNVRAAVWGGMGQDIRVSDVTADTCSDVCLDDESGYHISFRGFTVHNAKNGGIATFFTSRDVSFSSGTVTSDTASYALAFFHNQTWDPTKSYEVRGRNIRFVCAGGTSFCPINVDPIGGFELLSNTIENGMVVFVGPNNSGYHIDQNHFDYSFAPTSAFSAVGVPGHVYKFAHVSSISGNTFRSDNAVQAPGSYAISATIGDYDYADQLVVKDNVTSGWSTEFHFVAASENSGIIPVFTIAGNVLAANSITSAVAGFHGSFGPQGGSAMGSCLKLPCIVASVTPTTYSGTTGVAPFTIFTTPAGAGQIYRLCESISETVAPRAGAFMIQSKYTGAGQTKAVATPQNDSTDGTGCSTIMLDGATPIQVGVAASGVTGSPTIVYSATLERLK